MTPRPYIGHSTVEIAAMVDNADAATLELIQHELSHRSRPAAVKLAAEVKARITGQPVAFAPSPGFPNGGKGAPPPKPAPVMPPPVVPAMVDAPDPLAPFRRVLPTVTLTDPAKMAPTVAQLNADAKAGIPVSLSALAEAINRERKAVTPQVPANAWTPRPAPTPRAQPARVATVKPSRGRVNTAKF